MEDVEVLETSPIGREERADQDDQWSRIIELKLCLIQTTLVQR